ncbi:hypothetical protein [Neisseria zoodegmatis]|uniref:Transposase, IS30 family n=1 Tax=Neisseria zoodegmatis TaxID=326523 RepID=A0AB38DNN1_9NEIS|nr:transposase, IS30 family [Neisseria zoodegmatis]
MADVVEIGLFGEVLADKSVGIFIQPFLPRMVGTAKIGDWETDTIVGKDQRRTLLTLVERVTRYTIICKLKNFKAKDTTHTVIRVLKAHKARVHTITRDNGQRTTDNGQRTTDNGKEF